MEERREKREQMQREAKVFTWFDTMVRLRLQDKVLIDYIFIIADEYNILDDNNVFREFIFIRED